MGAVCSTSMVLSKIIFYLVQDGYTYTPGLSSRPPNVPLLRALWSLLDGIWGVLKCSWGVLV